MTKLEEIARAMCDDFLRKVFGEMGWDGNPPPNAQEMERDWREREYQDQKEMWNRAALAAVRAMREPSEAMIDAFAGVKPSDNVQDAARTWSAMLDSILSEAGEKP